MSRLTGCRQGHGREQHNLNNRAVTYAKGGPLVAGLICRLPVVATNRHADAVAGCPLLRDERA